MSEEKTADEAAPEPSSERTFRELVEMLKSTDRDVANEAVARLHDKYYAAIHVVIKGMLRSHAELNKMAESNIFWDSMIMALRDNDVNMDHTNPILLLKTIVQRKVINEMERLEADRRGGKAVVVSIPSAGQIAGNAPGASEALRFRELEAIIEHQKKAALTERERAFLALHDEGKTWGEIAIALKVDVKSAAAQYRYARNKLEKAVDEARES